MSAARGASAERPHDATRARMNWRELTLLALTIVGFVVPIGMVALFWVRHGLSLDGYLRHWGESLPATQLALDLGITFLAFALWASWEGKRLRMRSWWVPIPASLLVGVCFAVPLFLLLRERAVGERAHSRQTGNREPLSASSGSAPS